MDHLLLTGKGHLTDYIIKETLSNYEVEIIFDTETPCNIHPNTFDIFAYKNNNLLDRWRIYSCRWVELLKLKEKKLLILRKSILTKF